MSPDFSHGFSYGLEAAEMGQDLFLYYCSAEEDSSPDSIAHTVRLGFVAGAVAGGASEAATKDSAGL